MQHLCLIIRLQLLRYILHFYICLFRSPLALLRRIGRPFHSCTTLRTGWTVWTWWTSLGWTTETRASLDWLTCSSLWHRSSSLWWTTGTIKSSLGRVRNSYKLCTGGILPDLRHKYSLQIQGASNNNADSDLGKAMNNISDNTLLIS